MLGAGLEVEKTILEFKKTNNARRDRTFPGIDVERCFEKESSVEQCFPGEQAEMGRTRANTWRSCLFKDHAKSKQD